MEKSVLQSVCFIIDTFILTDLGCKLRKYKCTWWVIKKLERFRGFYSCLHPVCDQLLLNKSIRSRLNSNSCIHVSKIRCFLFLRLLKVSLRKRKKKKKKKRKKDIKSFDLSSRKKLTFRHTLVSISSDLKPWSVWIVRNVFCMHDCLGKHMRIFYVTVCKSIWL